MKVWNKLLLIGATLIATSSALAADVTPIDPIGTWQLERSANPLPDGRVVPYCTGAHGFIIYTSEGFVAVAINCSATAAGPEPADVSDRKFFYTGTYQIVGDHVVHTLLNASQPELIGETMTRAVKIDGAELTLTGVNQGQEFSALWRRVLPRGDEAPVVTRSRFARPAVTSVTAPSAANPPAECLGQPSAWEKNVQAALKDAGLGSAKGSDIIQTGFDFHDPEYDVKVNGQTVHVTCDDSGDDDCQCTVGATN